MRILSIGVGMAKLLDEPMICVLDNSETPQVVAVTGKADPNDPLFERSVRDAVAICLLLELLERGGLATRYVQEIEAESVRMIGIIKADLEVNQ